MYLPDLSRVQASRACGDRFGYLELLRTHNFDVALAERVLALLVFSFLQSRLKGRGFDPCRPSSHEHPRAIFGENDERTRRLTLDKLFWPRIRTQ